MALTTFAKNFADSLNMGVVLINQADEICLWNRWLERHSKLKTDDVIGKKFSNVFKSAIEMRVIHAIREALDFGWSSLLSHALHPMPLPLFPEKNISQQRIKQGLEIIPIIDDGQRMCLLQIRDVTEMVHREQLLRQQAKQLKNDLLTLTETQKELLQSEIRFRELARQVPAGLFELNKFGFWTYMNERCCQILGISLEKNNNNPWLNILPLDENIRLAPQWLLAIESNTRFTEECVYQHPISHQQIWLRIEAGASFSATGELIGYVGTIVDISEYRKRLYQSEYKASHDSLTGLFNRDYFEIHLRECLLQAQENASHLAVFMIDLNDFKAINDDYGHLTGDSVLKTIANRLKRSIRQANAVCRLGGDEFAIIMTDIHDKNTLRTIATRMQHAISLPINIGRKHVTVYASVGISIFPDDANNLEQLIHQADLNMYQKKRGVHSN